ncbi:hypothetical protein [Actinocrispum wychmicini]|uniref:Uncharacterized protein n=1 Tax=Actinocrispum wychmicini TaxID=1213861 RepID=A0A4V2S7G9_9PSEU|nr:hypothetical protein [Actinocrispum wychmicini]TCO59890.1 hypothetical protein EV192_104733 [Actinocrispum wychmicini]
MTATINTTIIRTERTVLGNPPNRRAQLRMRWEVSVDKNGNRSLRARWTEDKFGVAQK